MRMLRGRRRFAALAVLALSGLAGCAVFAPDDASPGARAAFEGRESSRGAVEGGMNQLSMELAFGDLVEKIEGAPGALRSQVDGVNVYLISDPESDRMRLDVPVARAENLDAPSLRILLQVNFDTTGDGRYSISGGIVYASFLHRISSLTRADLESALTQVVNLQKTFGTTFSSAGPAPDRNAGGGR